MTQATCRLCLAPFPYTGTNLLPQKGSPMGVDLRLLPFDCDLPTIVYSHTVLSCAGSYTLWDNMRALPASPVQDGFTAFVSREPVEGWDDTHYGEVREDCYGTPLRYVLAGALAQLSQAPEVQAHATNRAIWAYLEALPPETKVALFWH